MKIGILALQGDFIEHSNMLEYLGIQAIQVRRPEQLIGIDGLIIPGGESTTMLNLLHCYNLFQPIKQAALGGLPVMGTCAGMILLAKQVSNPDMETLALMDITVRRNAFGRQVDSFEAELNMPAVGKEPFPAVFIRAPFIESAGANVEVLSSLPDGTIVAARQDNLLALAFHPELCRDTRLHRYFLGMVAEYLSGNGKADAEEAVTAD
jgi:5'-phosphate synthase pdxT subunit